MNVALRTRIFIVDDLPSMRERLREIVAGLAGVEVVGDAGTPADAIEGILRLRPDCVLLDYQLDGGTGLDVLHAVHPQAPDIAFIVVTNHATAQHRRACIDAGARVFLDKSTEFGSLKNVIAGIDSASH